MYLLSCLLAICVYSFVCLRRLPIWNIYHFVIEFSEFPRYSVYKLFVRYMYCKYILPVCVLPCHFDEKIFLILRKSNSTGFSFFFFFLGFSFILYVFVTSVRHLCLSQVLKIFSYVFLWKLYSFSLYIEVWFFSIVCGVGFLFLPPAVAPTLFVESIWLLPLNCLGVLWKIKWLYRYGSISRLYFVPLIYLSVLMLMPHYITSVL